MVEVEVAAEEVAEEEGATEEGATEEEVVPVAPEEVVPVAPEEEEEEENTEVNTVFEISCISIPAQNDFPIPISMMTEESCKICNCVNT